MSTAATQPPRGTILALIAAVSIFALVTGLTLPLLAFQLETLGYGGLMIGISAAMTPLGMVVAGPLVPRIAGRLKTSRFLLLSFLAMVLLLFELPLFREYYTWLVLRFLIGLCLGGLYTVSEIALQKITPDESRGRIMGLYSTIMMLGASCGPAILAVTGSHGFLPFVTGAVCVGVAATTLMFVSGSLPEVCSEGEESAPLWSFAKLAPALLFAFAAVAVFEHGVLSLLPLFGTANGLSHAEASSLAAVAMVGAMALQFPVGLAGDRWGIYPVLVTCALGVLAGCWMMPLVVSESLLAFPLAFLWGGAAFGVYTMAVTELGQRFRGALLVAGNVMLNMMLGVGSLVGVPASGGAMDVMGPNGLLLVIGLVFAGIGVVYAPKMTRARTRKAAVGYA